MKRFARTLSVAAVTLTVGTGLAMAGGATVKSRQIQQQRRIAQGARSGELTRPEARRLERNAAAIHRSVRRDRIDGGVFARRERAKAQRRLNQQSRAIYRQKHDGQPK